MFKRQLLCTAVALAATTWAMGAIAQEFPPKKSITMVVGFAAGGAADTGARIIAKKLGENIGATVVVDNRAGAGGNIAHQFTVQGPTDGSLILLGSVGPLTIAQHMMKLPYDPVKDLSPITMGVNFPNVLVVGAHTGIKTFAEFVAYAKKNPGKLDFASTGPGSASHLAGELLNDMAKIDTVHVPYKGGAPALQDLLGGQVNAVADSSSWAPHVKAGTLRLLATWGEKRTQDFPDVPTLREAGYDVVVDAPNGVGAPKGLDPAIERRLREAFRVAAASPEFKTACDRIDAPLMYLDGPDYEKYVAATFRKETQLIERLKLRELIAKG